MNDGNEDMNDGNEEMNDAVKEFQKNEFNTYDGLPIVINNGIPCGIVRIREAPRVEKSTKIERITGIEQSEDHTPLYKQSSELISSILFVIVVATSIIIFLKFISMVPPESQEGITMLIGLIIAMLIISSARQ